MIKWFPITTSRLEYMVKWVQNYIRMYGSLPDDNEITKENLAMLPTDWNNLQKQSSKPRNATPHIAKTPQGKSDNITNRMSTGTMVSTMSYTPNQTRKNIKISITDFPKIG